MIKFTKMTALGNDYVYINCLENDINTDISTLAKNMSDRHFGIGSDGIVFIRKGNKAPFLWTCITLMVLALICVVMLLEVLLNIFMIMV